MLWARRVHLGHVPLQPLLERAPVHRADGLGGRLRESWQCERHLPPLPAATLTTAAALTALLTAAALAPSTLATAVGAPSADELYRGGGSTWSERLGLASARLLAPPNTCQQRLRTCLRTCLRACRPSNAALCTRSAAVGRRARWGTVGCGGS